MTQKPKEKTMRLHKITQEQLDTIATYMDDSIREMLHIRRVWATPRQFLAAYLRCDKKMKEVMRTEFSQLIDE